MFRNASCQVSTDSRAGNLTGFPEDGKSIRSIVNGDWKIVIG